MWKVMLVVLSVAAVAAETMVQCTEEFVSQHGSLLPLPGSCHKFQICTSGQLEERNCPSGMLFDVDSNRCISEVYARCSSEKWSKINGLCGVADEVSTHPDPYHCARYVLCLGVTAIPRQCSTGLLFNSETGKCDLPQNVVCDVSCPSGGNDLVFLPESSGRNCAGYFICLNGDPHPAECSSMLYFDLVTGTCTRPADASCSIKGVYCSEHDEKVVDPRSCSSYYECEDGFPHYRECEVGQHFMNGLCVPGDCEDSGTTEISSTTVSSTSSETQTTTDVTMESSTMSLESSTNTDSTIEITTTETSTVTESQQPTTETSESTVTQSTSAASTEESSTVTSTILASTTESNYSSSTTESTTATQTELSTTEAHSTTAASTNSSTVVSTITEEPSTMVASTTSNPTTGSSTVSDIISTTEFTSTTTEEPLDPAEVCRDVNIEVVPHPFNCYQYFVCIFNSGRMVTCDDGQIFDTQSLTCVSGDRETCTQRNLDMLLL